jgi:hypothetical protein
MTDNELSAWRREWHSQPSVPLDLVRKVERQTVYMKLQLFALIAPILVGAGTIVLALIMRTVPSTILAVGTWAFILFGLRFELKNRKGVWTAASQTTAAYVELSIVRCQRDLNAIRYSFVFTPLLTTFVLITVFAILVHRNALNIARDYWNIAGAFAYSFVIVAIVALAMLAKRKKVRRELNYLLNLQRQFGADA